jgi:hypothetical protein
MSETGLVEKYKEPEDLSNVLMCHHITFKHDFSGQTIIFGGIYGTGKIFIGQRGCQTRST